MAFDKFQDFSNAKDGVNAWGWYDDRDHIIGSSHDDDLAGSRGADEIHGGDGDDFLTDLTYTFAAWIGPSLFFDSSGAVDRDALSRLELAHLDEDRHARDLDGETQWHPWGVVTFQEGGDDRFFGDGGDDTLAGRSGNDLLDGGADNDQVWGGTGDDTVIGGSGDDDLFGNSGNDTLLGGSGTDILLGGTGADFLQGGLGADIIEGGDLAANAFALQVAQGILTQAQANATIAAANAGDTVNYDNSLGVDVDLERATQFGGEAQGDTITGVENIDGSRFGDTLRGDNKANVLFGNFGGDVLEGRGGADTLLGGDGIDTASYESSGGRVNVDLVRGTGQLADAAGDTYSAIENITGSRFADTLRGDEASFGNRIDGGDGDDIIEGRGGTDTLNGGIGVDTLDGGNDNDVLDGGLGNDTLIGGQGIDTAEFDSFDTVTSSGTLTFAPKITIDLAGGLATKSVLNIQTFRYDVVEQDTLSGIENARGSNNADLFIGTNGDNTFSGRDGNDTFRADDGRDTYNGDAGVDTVDYSASSAVTVNLNFGIAGVGGLAAGDLYNAIENVIGTSGKDTLTGNNSDNRLTGGGGDDTINGGGGDDTIVGGTETDIEVLSGGAGRDTFLYLSRADSFTTATHTGDKIIDFNTDQDLIDLRALGNMTNLTIINGLESGIRVAHVFEDINNNGLADSNEFNLNIIVTGGALDLTMQDLLV